MQATSSEDDEDFDPFTTDKLGFAEIGVITGAHGVKGEAKVRSSSDFAQERLTEPNSQRYLLYPGRKYPRPIKLIGGRKATQPDTWIVKLENIPSREFINDNMKGCRLFVKSRDRPKSLKKDEFLAGEIEGMFVRLISQSSQNVGHIIGIVQEVITCKEISSGSSGNTAALYGNDLLMVEIFSAQLQRRIMEEEKAIWEKLVRDRDRFIKREDKNVVWVPFVRQIVPFVDALLREIHVDPPEGLFEIAKIPQEPEQRRVKGLLAPAKD